MVAATATPRCDQAAASPSELPSLPLHSSVDLQHKYEGEEVDFVESYFFPEYETFAAELAAQRAARAAAAAADQAQA